MLDGVSYARTRTHTQNTWQIGGCASVELNPFIVRGTMTSGRRVNEAKYASHSIEYAGTREHSRTNVYAVESEDSKNKKNKK